MNGIGYLMLLGYAILILIPLNIVLLIIYKLIAIKVDKNPGTYLMERRWKSDYLKDELYNKEDYNDKR